MNRNRLFLSSIFLTAALIAPIVVAKLHAQGGTQTTTTQTTRRDAQAPDSQTTTVKTTTEVVEQTYTGKINKKEDQYILENKDKKSSYKLDDATRAEKFNGDDVKVVGTLDTPSNMIHVQSIEKLHD
jgi:uncharacterized protein YdeI (BOF family)